MPHQSVTVNLRSEVIDMIDSLISPAQGYTRATWLREIIYSELTRRGYDVDAYRQKFFVKSSDTTAPQVDDKAIDGVMRKLGLSDGAIKSVPKTCTECDSMIPAGLRKCPECGAIN